MSEDFSVENVKICAQAVCNFMSDRGMGQNGLIIGYDTRLNSEIFAKTVAEVATGNQIPVVLCEKPCPTPVLSYNLVLRECGAGVVITASHNSKEWNGFKFKPSYGGSASPEITSEIEITLGNLPEQAEEDAEKGIFWLNNLGNIIIRSLDMITSQFVLEIKNPVLMYSVTKETFKCSKQQSILD